MVWVAAVRGWVMMDISMYLKMCRDLYMAVIVRTVIVQAVIMRAVIVRVMRERMHVPRMTVVMPPVPADRPAPADAAM